MPGSLDGSWKTRSAERDAAIGAFLQLDPSIGAADSALRHEIEVAATKLQVASDAALAAKKAAKAAAKAAP